MNRAEAARKAAIGLAGGRVAFGVAMLAAPREVAMNWVGRDARKTGTRLLTRATGGRDAALGIGAIAALVRRDDARLWIGAQVTADITDLVATAIAGDDLPPMGRRGVLALAGGATVAGIATLVALNGGEPDPSSRPAPDVTVPAASTADGMDAVVIGGEGQDDAPAH